MRKNKLIEELAVKSLVYVDTGLDDGRELIFSKEKFVELIVNECVAQCRQEWYNLNNAVIDPDELYNDRDIGFRVGQKVGILDCVNKIKQHFELKE